MTNTVLIKRSGTANAIPTAGQLSLGELAINYNDGNLFYKNSGGTVTLLTSNQFVSVAGNVTGGNLNAVGLSLSGNVISTFNVTGNVNGGNLRTSGLISATGNVTGGNINTGGVVSATGIVSGVELTSTNAVGSEGGQLNLAAAPSGTLSGSSVTIDIYNNQLRFFEQGGSARGAYIDLSAAAAGVGSNLLAGGSSSTPTQIVNGTSNVSVTTSANITANVAGAWVASFYSAGMIANSFWANNNATGQNFKVGDDAWIGDINTADTMSVRGQQSAANGYIVFGNADNTQLGRAGSGPLTYGGAFSATGNITGGNIATAGLITASGNIIGNRIAVAAGTAAAPSVQFSNDISADTGFYWVSDGNIGITTNGTLRATFLDTGLSVVGNVTSGNLNAAGLSLSSNVVSALNVTGNIAGGNITTPGIISATSNVSGGNLAAATTIFSFGTIQGTGNVSGGNLTTGAQVSATGNITGGNVITGGAISAASVSASGNVTGGNLITSAAVSAASVSASGNVTGGNIIGTTAVVVPTVRNTAALTISTSSGDLNLQPTGNIVVNTKYINGVSDPVQNQDVATKAYVDNLATSGISYHQPVAAASTTTMAATTGGTITYTQPNGAGNGVGALLTTTGSFNLIDTANVQTLGTRILVKDEANAVYNGVYTWANATNIVRSTDADEYGPDSTIALSINDYFYTTGGNVNKGTAFVVSAPSGTITFGTSNITFSTFATSQVYTANTAAGVSLAGTVINAKVDNTTTAFDGTGNISVKTGAQLTTPNIGAATGTSLSVTGNITGGNLNAAGLSLSSNVVSALNVTGNIAGGNITTPGLISVTGNITGGNILGGANVNATTHTGTTVSVTSTVTGSAYTATAASGTIFTANVANAGMELGLVNAVNTPYIDFHSSGNATVDYDTRIISSGGSGTVGQGTLSVVGATLAVTGAISAVGNVTGGNLNAAGLSLSSNVVSALNVTANIAGGNITTPGLISATGNITGGNLNAAGLSLSSNVVSALNVTGNIAGGNVIQSGVRVAKYTTSETTPTNAVPGDQWFIASTGKRYEYINDGTGNVWVDQSQSTSFDNLAVSGAATITGALTVGSILTVATSSITNTGANGVGNIGNATGYFNTIFARATSAQYADLAETYVPDGCYTYGTVVIFGGDKEITVSNVSHDTRVAGVISKDPAHLMNSAIEGVPVALTGRVLCQVRGPVQKGDILVNIESGTAGRLDPALASWGCVVGKSLVDHPTNDVAMIEIAVGRF